jgi:hypothetical protein
MLIEAILTVCLSTPINDWKGDSDSGPTCVYMNISGRTFPATPTGIQQCHHWVTQGKMEVSTREHRDALHRRLPWSTIEESYPVIKGVCKITWFEEPYICQDCDS